MIVSSELSDLSYGALILFIPKIPKIGISISLAYIISDLLTGIVDLNDLSPQVIAIGDICHCVSKNIEDRIKLDNSQFYYFDETLDRIRDKVELLCQIRVVGENKYVSMSDARNVLVEIRDFFAYGATSEDVYRFCASAIYKILSLTSKCNFNIKLNYSEHNKNFYRYYVDNWS